MKADHGVQEGVCFLPSLSGALWVGGVIFDVHGGILGKDVKAENVEDVYVNLCP